MQLIQAYHWSCCIIWPLVDVEHPLHLADEGGIPGWRNHLHLSFTRFKGFFCTPPIIAGLALGSTCNSTNWSASNCNVQWARPDGRGEQVAAFKWASTSPVYWLASHC